MRTVLTSDTHWTVDLKTIPDGDVFIHAGDLCSSGYPDDWKTQLEWLAQLPHKTKIFVPGNHDFHITVYPGPALQDMRRIGFTVLGLPGNVHYTSMKLENGMTVLGLPFIKNRPRWCFNETEEFVAEYIKTMVPADIVVSHSPVYGILDVDNEIKSGFKCYARYIRRHAPKYWVHGHVHESYGEAKLENTKIYNVAMSDRFHTHANKPIVLDI